MTDAYANIALTGKVALVTGAGLGMGRATAILLARRGAKVIVSDITEETGRDTTRAITDMGLEASFVRADISREEDVAALVAATVERFGRLDCAVNNAAIAPDTHEIAELDFAEVDRVLAVNLRGVMLCMRYEIAQMLAQGAGAVVNIGSVSSARPQAGNAAYVAAKHGVIGLTRTGSLEYAARGIRVNAVLPGVIDTPMNSSAMEKLGVSQEQVAAILSLLGRFGRPEEVAEASAWLCSDAASFVTGHALAVDAGYLSR